MSVTNQDFSAGWIGSTVGSFLASCRSDLLSFGGYAMVTSLDEGSGG